jgi:hypothetical protein
VLAAVAPARCQARRRPGSRVRDGDDMVEQVVSGAIGDGDDLAAVKDGLSRRRW